MLNVFCIVTSQHLDGILRITQDWHNDIRLHIATGYVTPHTKLAGEDRDVFTARDRKLEAAREQCRKQRQQQAA